MIILSKVLKESNQFKILAIKVAAKRTLDNALLLIRIIITTCDKFSEDMDFSLLAPSQDFDFTQYFQPIVDQFAMVGREVEIKKKDKKNFCKVESAFLKDNTDVYDITFQTEKSIKIKIEVDTQPPLKFLTEQKLLLLPQSFMTRCFTLPDGTKAIASATFIYDLLFHTSGPVCRQDARLGLSSLEEPRQGS